MDTDEFHGFWPHFERGFNTVWITKFQHEVACRIGNSGSICASCEAYRETFRRATRTQSWLNMFSMTSIIFSLFAPSVPAVGYKVKRPVLFKNRASGTATRGERVWSSVSDHDKP